jgi:hypothetical protein
MGTLDKLKSRLRPTSGPSQTDHKRLAEIKLTQERLNKPKHERTTPWKFLPKPRTLGGAGGLELIAGGGVVGKAFNLSKRLKMAPLMDIKIKED